MTPIYLYLLGPLVLVALAIVAMRVAADENTIKVKKKEVNHLRQWLFTGIAVGFVSVVMYFASGLSPWRPFLLMSAVFFATFDYTLNVVLGKKWSYIDLGTDGKRSFFDSIYEVLGIVGTLFIKLITLIVFTVLYLFGTETPNW